MNLRPRPRRPHWALAALLLSPILLLGVSCRSARPAPHESESIATPTEPTADVVDLEITPAWVGQPLSWEKLDAIEGWLAGLPPASAGGPEGQSFWRVEGELQLAQGRLELARREQNGKNITPQQISARMRSARSSLERIAQDPSASEGQRQRAQNLMARASTLLDSKKAVSASSLSQLGIVSRGAWSAASAHPERMEKNRGGWRRITVHHSAEENAPDLDGSIADSAAAIRQMQRSHMESKSPRWGDIGYHFLIDPAGHIFQGRELTWQGAHAEGDNNIQNIGICLIGNFDEEQPSRAALDSLRRLLDTLRKTYSISKGAVLGHQDLKSTRCPGRHLEPWVRGYSGVEDQASRRP